MKIRNRGALPLFCAGASALTGIPAVLQAAPVADTPLEAVIVTARRLREEIDIERALTPGGVSVVDGAELYRRNVTNLADVLRYVPGMWAESVSGADDVFFSSRGSNLDAVDYDRNGVKMLQDGLPVTTADGNNHNRNIDPLSARYVVIARGANALTYGASTLGGAIDFRSPTARTEAPASMFLSGGSHGSLNGRLTAGAVAGDVDGFATIETKQFDGYRDHSSQDRWGVYANAGWQMSDRWSARVYATWLDNEVELPGALTRAEVDDDPDQASAAALGGDYGKQVETGRLAVKTTWQIDANSRLDAGLSYEGQSLYHPIVDKILVDFDGPGPAPPVEVFSLIVDTDHRDVGAMLRYSLKLGSHDVLAGVNYGDGRVEGGNYRNDGGNRNGITQQVDNSADTLEAFVVDRWQLGSAWTLVYGFQAVDATRDVRTTDVPGGAVRNPRDSYSSFNPRLGVLYSLGDSGELYASVSRLFEAPTTFQMEDDVRGNDETLDAMHGTVYEIGTRSRPDTAGTGTRWHWDVSVYYAQIEDEILSIDNPAAPGDSLATNVDETIHAGVEALVGASFALDASGRHRLEPLVSLAFNEFSFDGDPVYGDNDLPAAPEYAVRGELLYRHANGFYGGPTFDLVDERYADFSNTYTVDSYELLGLRLGYAAAKWEVFGEVRNLLDEDYIATVGVLDVAPANARVLYPGAPLSAYAGVRWQF